MSHVRSVANNIQSVSQIYTALAPSKIPKPGTSRGQAQRAAKDAGLSLIAVSSYDLAQNQHVASKFLTAWPNIWKWVEFLHSKCIVEATYGESIMLSSVLAIGRVLKTLATDPPICDLMGNTPGVFSMVVHYWSKEGTDMSMELANANGLFTSALYSLINDGENMSSILPIILDAVEGGAETIARASLEHLSKALDHVPIDLFDIHCHLILMSHFACDEPPSLCAAFHSRKPILATMKALDVVSTSASSSHPELKAMVTGQCFITTANVLESTTQTPSELRHVLDDGFLVSLFKSGAQLIHMREDKREQIIKKIFDFMGRHLVFHSVLGSVMKSLERIRLDIDGEVAIPIRNAWLEFQRAAEERLVRRKCFDEDEKSATGSGYGCQRQECPVRSNNAQLRKCSSCKSSQWCSTQCQRLDWPTHRKPCQAMRDLKAGASVFLSTRDQRFLHYLARDDYQLKVHPEAIALRGKTSGILSSTSFARLNYQSFPPTYSILPISPFEWHAGEIETRDRLLCRARESEGKCILHRIEYRLGPYTRTNMQLCCFPDVQSYIMINYADL